MKRFWILSIAAVVALSVVVAADLTKLEAQMTGSRVTIDGTSTVHDWTVQGGIIGGVLELDSKFIADPTKAQPGKVDAKVQATIPVRTIKEVHGRKSMDDIMHEAMKQKVQPKIEYRLTELTLKETPKSAEGPFNFDSKGELAVAGVTNKVAFPVTMTRVDKTKMKTSGTTSVKMTSFGIQPPSPKIALGFISTGDDVKITFEWMTAAPETK
ncbi:MAG TPA: YceI family protein [Candidatus Limnocylindria bacterium]|nr:YceI family protein [Candidatus Limnocylindria bacterium]